MTELKRSIPESLKEEMMLKYSLLCKIQCGQIMQHYKNNAPQH